jgi:hypothetical protein
MALRHCSILVMGLLFYLKVKNKLRKTTILDPSMRGHHESPGGPSLSDCLFLYTAITGFD